MPLPRSAHEYEPCAAARPPLNQAVIPHGQRDADVGGRWLLALVFALGWAGPAPSQVAVIDHERLDPVASGAGSSKAFQSLALNGDFATDLTGWVDSGQGEAEWSTLDVDGSPDSGSAQLTSRELVAGQRVYPLSVCIDVKHPGRYFLGSSGRLAPGQGSGRLVFSYAVRMSDDCSGGFHSVGGNFLNTVGSWGQVAAQVTVFEPAGSIEILLGIEKDAEGGDLHGNIDAVFLLLDEGVFANGFE